MDEAPEKIRKARSDKGKKRGPKTALVAAAPAAAPINVRVTLRNGADPVEFGCARRDLVNGFHVFFYPSKTDPYRETRREFAISEIVEIEITEAARYEPKPERLYTPEMLSVLPKPMLTPTNSGPKIHSVRKNAAGIIGQLEQAQGSIKMDQMPNLSFGDSEA